MKLSRTAGFTLIECIISLLALGIVYVSVLHAMTLAFKIDAYTKNAYASGALLEGVVAGARTASASEAAEASDISDIINGLDTAGDYDFALSIEDMSAGDVYSFTDGIVPKASYTYTPAVDKPVNAYYDKVADEGTPVIIIDETHTGSFHIKAALPAECVLSIINNSEANVFADIEGDGEIIYTGGGILTRTRLNEREEALFITAAVYTKDDELLNAITAVE